MKKLGFAPPTFDLKKTTVELMTEQAAAFYDYRKRQMVLLQGDAPGMMQDMALVHELVKLHGGAVSVDSAEGQGSTFTVRLPVASQDPAETSAERAG